MNRRVENEAVREINEVRTNTKCELRQRKDIDGVKKTNDKVYGN